MAKVIVDESNDNLQFGYLKLFRSIRKHWIWEDPRRLKWWIDILMEVNHSPKRVLIKGSLFDCDRGQSLNSLGTWAKSWRVGIKRVRVFLDLLEKDSMIVRESVGKTTRLTVCNYASYNDVGQDEGNLRATSGQAEGKQRATNKNGKKEKNDKNIYIQGEFGPFEFNELNESWQRWLTYRREIKKPITLTAAETQIEFLQKFPATVAVEIINQSIRNQWQGLFELKKQVNGTSKNKQPTADDLREFVYGRGAGGSGV